MPRSLGAQVYGCRSLGNRQKGLNMELPTQDGSATPVKDEASRTVGLLNGLLRDAGTDRAVAMSAVLRAQVDSRGGDDAVASAARIEVQELSAAIGPATMNTVIELSGLVAAAGLQLEFKAS